MSYYAIGIGGTGAKCLESLIHLAAAGLMPDEEDLNLLFVDPDGANGSLGRATSLLSNYRDCRAGRVAGFDLFKTPINPTLKQGSTEPNSDIWSPLENGKRQLDNFFNSNLLSPEAGHLFNLLYSPEEQKTNLEVGFRGRPAIGAAVMASAINLDNAEPWKSIKQKMQGEVGNAKSVKIVLFGSIFGGTGAAGFPTIAKIIKLWIESFPNPQKAPVKLGGVLLLPYFSFSQPIENGIAASSDDFLLSSQAALQYYHQKADLEVFDETFVLGSEDRLQMRKSEIGGRLQENDPHFVELYAALAAVDFFSNVNGNGAAANGSRYKMVARSKSDALGWHDLPSNGDELQDKLMKMTRFAFAYLSQYHPILKDISEHGRSYRSPWYMSFFEFKDVPIRDELGGRLRSVKEYCEAFLLWIARVEFSISGKQTKASNLVEISTFTAVENDAAGRGDVTLKSVIDPNGFAAISLPNMQSDAATLSHVWECMCGARSKGNKENGTWHFLNELYRQCGN
ncbi:MAG: hypothetical protein IPL32_03695 [Chloracidobacterium sp.]|nr:hypothetical protein [Chloracidobacterium sp.]